eukprot:CAMPEP_0195292048 /NCGR_PEP_ID=MMETSP0707-20130614/8581_1 /TAXON_ID=33640 /ORGANISM="Asterionellopsis glacialis, Strain CCMP134" /LENGTH=363 /DNA_ID=CAMNT_0040352427 /DNA_START=35 /DNA_END=1126 /DNA_ORIENTATION=+
MFFNKGALLFFAAQSALTLTSGFVAPTRFGLVQQSSSFITRVASEPIETDAAEDVAAAPVEEAAPPAKERITMFIGNLNFDTTDAEIRDLFAEFGKVELVSVPRNNETGKSRGFAFVDMSSEEELQAAIDALNGTQLAGRTIRVNKSLPKDKMTKKPRNRNEVEDGFMKIYVGNIPFDTNRDELVEFYEQYGNVKEVYIPTDVNTGGPRGFAFVTMAEEDALNAIDETNGVMYQGRTLAVSKPLPRGEKAPPRSFAPRTKLYVGNLSFYTELETVQQLFGEYGDVLDCYMPMDRETGSSRGFAFVTMSPDDAATAMGDIDGYELDGRIVRVNEAQPKGEPVSNYNDEGDDFEGDDFEGDEEYN